MKLRANQYCASITPRTAKRKPKKRKTKSQLKSNGDDNYSLLTITTSPLFGKRLWEMRHGRALWANILHRSSWKLYLLLDFSNYLFTQPPIWLVIYWAHYEKFAHKGYIKKRIYWFAMDTDQDFSYKWETNSNNQNPNSTNPRSTKYNLRHHPKPNCKQNYRHLVCSTERLSTFSGNPMNVLCKWYGANTYIFLEAPVSYPGRARMSWVSMDFGNSNSQFVSSRNIFPVHLNLLYGASSETTPRKSPILIPETRRNSNKLCLVFWG